MGSEDGAREGGREGGRDGAREDGREAGLNILSIETVLVSVVVAGDEGRLISVGSGIVKAEANGVFDSSGESGVALCQGVGGSGVSGDIGVSNVSCCPLCAGVFASIRPAKSNGPGLDCLVSLLNCFGVWSLSSNSCERGGDEGGGTDSTRNIGVRSFEGERHGEGGITVRSR